MLDLLHQIWIINAYTYTNQWTISELSIIAGAYLQKPNINIVLAMVLFAYSRATKGDAISSRKAYTLVRLLLSFTILDIAMGPGLHHLFSHQ